MFVSADSVHHTAKIVWLENFNHSLLDVLGSGLTTQIFRCLLLRAERARGGRCMSGGGSYLHNIY